MSLCITHVHAAGADSACNAVQKVQHTVVMHCTQQPMEVACPGCGAAGRQHKFAQQLCACLQRICQDACPRMDEISVCGIVICREREMDADEEYDVDGGLDLVESRSRKGTKVGRPWNMCGVRVSERWSVSSAQV